MPTSHLVEPATRSGEKSPAASLKSESRRHEAEPDRTKPGETSSSSAVFKHLPAEIFLTSVVFAFRHGFCRAKAQNYGSQKIHVRLFPAILPNFPGRIDARRGREPQEPAQRQFRLAGKSFFLTSVVRAPKPTFPDVSSTYLVSAPTRETASYRFARLRPRLCPRSARGLRPGFARAETGLRPG